MSVPPEDENNNKEMNEDNQKILREGEEQKPSDVKEEDKKEIPLDDEQKDISTNIENSGETESKEKVTKSEEEMSESKEEEGEYIEEVNESKEEMGESKEETRKSEEEVVESKEKTTKSEEEVVESKEKITKSEGKSTKMGEQKESIEVPPNQSIAEEIEENETSNAEVVKSPETQIDKLVPVEETLEENPMSVSRKNIPPRERSDLNKILLSIVFIIPLNFILSMIQVYIFFNNGMNTYLPWYKDMNAFTEQFIPLGNFSFVALSTVFFLIYISVVYMDARKRS